MWPAERWKVFYDRPNKKKVAHVSCRLSLVLFFSLPLSLFLLSFLLLVLPHYSFSLYVSSMLTVKLCFFFLMRLITFLPSSTFIVWCILELFLNFNDTDVICKMFLACMKVVSDWHILFLISYVYFPSDDTFVLQHLNVSTCLKFVLCTLHQAYVSSLFVI